jgi:hypothetical protein
MTATLFLRLVRLKNHPPYRALGCLALQSQWEKRKNRKKTGKIPVSGG